MLFGTRPARAVVGDLNADLLNLYHVVKDAPFKLLEVVTAYPNDKAFYLDIRSIDRDDDRFESLSDIERAARFLYLNRAGYNGLYRVNSKNQFNVPFGNYRRLNYGEQNILEVSRYLNTADISLLEAPYGVTIETAEPGDFVYFDPPYDPLSKTASFTSYDASGFSTDDQIALRDACDDLTRKGVNFLLSNSHTPLIRDLYSEYELTVVKARRSINSDGSKRGPVDEVLVRNYV